MTELDKGEIYKGPSGALKDSRWLTAEDLPTDRDTVVQIEAVVRRKNVEFARPGGKVDKKDIFGSLRFVGKSKELGLNTTNRRTLDALFSSNCEAWYGKKVALYVDDNVNSFGHIVSAVRIRAKRVE